VRSAHPGGCAAGLVGFAAPGLRALLPLAGDGMEAPEPFTGIRVVGVDEAAAGRISAGDAHDDLVADDKRRLLGILVLLYLAYLDVPADAPGLGIERHEVGVQSSHVHCPVDDRDTPIRRPA